MNDFNTYATITGTFVPNDTTAAMSFSGTLFRCVPHGTATPLSTDYAFTAGGRWNLKQSYPVLYTAASATVARYFVDAQAARYGFTWSERPEDDQPDLLLIEFTATLADVATDPGVQNYGLPTTYPIGYETEDSWAITQPIGASIHAAGFAGLVARSATSPTWSGDITAWAEVAIFTDNAPLPNLTARVAFKDWYEPR